MKKILTLSLLLSIVFMQGEIGGYAIFDYNGTTQQFDIDRTYFQYTNDISDNLFFKLRFDVGRSSDILDADSNNLAVGGWSMGANKYQVIHTGRTDGQIVSNMIAADTIAESNMANDAIGSAELKSLSTLLIKNSSGTTLKTVHGAGA